MPVGFNSPARNLFLLGSSGQQVVTNFFETIDKSSTTDGVFIPDEIKYIATNKKYALAGSAADSNSKSFGWLERQDYNLETGGLTTDYSNRIESTQSGVNTTLRAMELDVNDNLIVVGKTGTIPWIAKYSNDGVLDWSSTTNSADVAYLDVASDSNGKYYACGRTPLTSTGATDTQAFVESFDTNGNPGWGKQAFMLGREVTARAIDANDRGHVVAAGFLEDDTRDKGYIVKINTATGEVMWDRTLTNPDGDMRCTDVFIDSKDQIYVIGNDSTHGYLLKYSAEGNMIWQKKTNQSSGTLINLRVQSDGETEQTIVFGRYEINGDQSGILSKYAKDGRLVFRRMLTSSNNNSDTFSSLCLDADPSFYYFMYTDQAYDGLAGTPDRYTFGKVSSSGNGLGDFQYTEGTGTTIDYEILNEGDVIGRLSDGSVRNDTSDLIAYPFGANKLLFDDLATQVTNKRRQMDGPDSFEYSGSPAIRVADYQELNLLGESENVEFGNDIVSNGSMGYNGRGVQIDAFLYWNSVNASLQNQAYYYPDNNTLRVTNTTNAQGYAWQEIPAEVGRQYTISVHIADISGQQNCRLQVGSAHGLGDYVDESLDASGTISARDRFTFIPTTGNTFITLKVDSATSGDFTTIDRVTVQINNWRDSSKNEFLAAALGASHNAAGGYWDFGGADHKISVPYNDAWTLPGDFTLEAWIYRDIAFNSNWWQDSIMAHDDGSGNNNKWIFSHNGTSLFFHTNTTAGSAQSIQAPTGWVPTNSVWYNVVVTRSGNTYTFYQNSTSLGSVTNSAAIPVASAPLTIGNAEGGGLFDGRFGEVRVYPKALSAQAVFQNYNATKTKYINEAPDVAPKISDSSIVYNSNLILNYDFKNRGTYDRVENLVVRSEDFSGSEWAAGGSGGKVTVTNTDILSPFGSKNVQLLDDVSTGQDAQATDENIAIPASNSQDYCFSVYAKKGTAAKFDLYIFYTNVSVVGYRLTYVWDTDSLTAAGAEGANGVAPNYGYEDVGNGWYRFWLSASDQSLNTQLQARIYPASRDTGPTGSTYFWGAQVEKGSTPGRYIKTSGTAITAPTTVKNLSSSSYPGTINGATLSDDGSFYFGNNHDITSSLNWTPANQFSFTMWFRLDQLKDFQSLVDLFNSTSFRNFQLFVESDGDLRVYWGDTSGTSAITSTAATTWYYAAFSCNGETGTLYRYNGSDYDFVAVSASAGSYSVKPLVLGKRGDDDTNSFLDGKIGEFQFYNTELSPAQILQNYNATRGKYGV